MDKEERTSTFFDRYSDGFNAIYGSRNNVFWNFIDKHFRKTMLLRFQDVIGKCQPGEDKTVLDVGCGPGHYMVALIKKGLGHAHGLDFAPKMIEIAKRHATEAGVVDKCSFEVGDFLKANEDTKYSYVVLMGFMDYIEHPEQVIQKAIHIAREKVMFSFPTSKGFLAWQRKMRYKFKCPLYLYSEKQLHGLFNKLPGWKYTITDYKRDYFVTLEKTDK